LEAFEKCFIVFPRKKYLTNRMNPSKKEEEFVSILSVTPGGIKKLNPDEISYKIREHPKTIRNYIVGETLGEGSFGKVYEVLDCKTYQRYAMKIVKKRKVRKIPGAEQCVKREIEILQKIHHINCIQLIEWFSNEDKGAIYIITEYVGGRTLQNLLEKAPEKRLPTFQARKYFRDLVEAMDYIHKQKMVHRDIKPDNCLLTSTGVLKLCDFGVACLLDSSDPMKGSGSPAFQSPEFASGSMVSGAKIDIWAAGITLYIMTIGKFPFEGPNVYSLFESISTGTYTIPDWLEPNLADVICSMVKVDFEKRISIQEIRDHPWMTMDIPEEEPVPISIASTMFKPHRRTCACSVM